MELVAKANGVISSFRTAFWVNSGCIGVVGESQMYGEGFAEDITVSYTFNTRRDGGEAALHPLSPFDIDLIKCAGSLLNEDKIILPRNSGRSKSVEIDKKGLRVVVYDAGTAKHVIPLEDSTRKIICNDTVGSIDYCHERDLLLMTVIPVDKGKDSKKYSDEKFRFKDNLGEAMDEIEADLQIMVVDTANGKILIVDLKSLHVIKAGLAVDGSIYFTALNRQLPRNTGIVYCSNKPIGLYKLDRVEEETPYSAGEVRVINDTASIRSLRFSKDRGRFIYLKCPLGGAHLQPSELVVYDCQSKTAKVLQSELFVGSVFGMNIPAQEWTEWIYMTTQKGFYGGISRVNADTGKLEVLSRAEESWCVVSVLDDAVVVGQCSSIIAPPALGLFRDGELIMRQPKSDAFMLNSASKRLIHVHEHCEALLVMPGGDNYKREVLLMPHGGPNSNYVDEYLPHLAVLLSAGYALCRINYTGSTGYGRKSIDLLIGGGQVGIADVQDCMLVHKRLQEIGFEAFHIFGGSHGGFLAASLSSAYPKSFKTCVMINPVVAIYANCVASDIFDYFYENLGLEYKTCRPPSEQEIQLFSSRSPRPTSDNPPTLVLVGGKDRRVPPFNGISWYGWLKGLGVRAECLYFPDSNHGISQPEADRNLQVKILEFLSLS